MECRNTRNNNETALQKLTISLKEPHNPDIVEDVSVSRHCKPSEKIQKSQDQTSRSPKCKTV